MKPALVWCRSRKETEPDGELAPLVPTHHKQANDQRQPHSETSITILLFDLSQWKLLRKAVMPYPPVYEACRTLKPVYAWSFPAAAAGICGRDPSGSSCLFG